MEQISDTKALEEKKAFFDVERKKRRQNQYSSIRNGWMIIVAVALFDYFVAPLFGAIAMVIGWFAFATITILVIRFIWAPWDVCWVALVKPRYYKILVRGGNLIRPIANGIAFTEEWWEPVDPSHKKAKFFDRSLWGVHIIKTWPFAQVYEEEVEYKRYYDRLERGVLKRELMTQFTLMVYPHYIEVVDAKDAKKADVRMGITWITRVTSIIKAHFKEATTWIDVTTPLIKGGMKSFIQNSTVEKIRALDDVGKTLFEEMLSPKKELNNKMVDPLIPGGPLVRMIEDSYGIKTESISMNLFKGDNPEVEEAITAQSLADFRRDAQLIYADADAKSLAERTMGAAITMLAKTIVKIMDTDEEQKKALNEAKNFLTSLKRDSPEDFEKIYGKRFDQCIDFVTRNMSIEGGSLIDARTPDAKGETASLMSTLVVSGLLSRNRENGSGATKKQTKDVSGGDESGVDPKKRKKLLREAGFLDEIDEED
jgi:hypothetical protein